MPLVLWSNDPATNKKLKVIIVAVIRKMITTLNAMLRDNVAWQSKPASAKHHSCSFDHLLAAFCLLRLLYAQHDGPSAQHDRYKKRGI